MGEPLVTNETMTDVLVKLGRIEEILNLLLQKVDKLEEDTKERFNGVEAERDRMWRKINSLDTELQVLRDRQGPKVHWTSMLAVAVSTLGFLAAFIIWVVK